MNERFINFNNESRDMSQSISRKRNFANILGIFACLIIIVTTIFYWVGSPMIVTIVDSGTYILIMDIVGRIRMGGWLLVFFSFIFYASQLNKPLNTIMIALLIIACVFTFVDLVLGIFLPPGINWGSVGFLKRIVRGVPIGILFIVFFKFEVFAKILTFIHPLHLFIQLLISIVIMINNTSSIIWPLIQLGYILIILDALLIGVWLIIGIPDLKDLQPKTHYDRIEEKVISSQTTTSTTSYKEPYQEPSFNTAGNGVPPTSEWKHGIPRLQYWCPKCNKKSKFKPRNNKQIEQENPCPTCSTTLLAWWVEPKRNLYFQFVAGGILIAGGLMTYLFETMLGNYGLIPLIILSLLTLSEMISGFIVLYTVTKKTNTPPPSYATTKPSLEPQQIFVKELILIVVLMFGGGLIIYGINAGILSAIF